MSIYRKIRNRLGYVVLIYYNSKTKPINIIILYSDNMTIHLIECDERPKDGSVVKASCDEEILFESPIDINYVHGNICKRCLCIHRHILYRKKTFAHNKR